jgi:hypothetical protein
MATSTIDTATATRIERHAVTDNATGIGISEDGDQVIITGLDQLPPDALQSLQTLVGVWKYGIVEDTSGDA